MFDKLWVDKARRFVRFIPRLRMDECVAMARCNRYGTVFVAPNGQIVYLAASERLNPQRHGFRRF